MNLSFNFCVRLVLFACLFWLNCYFVVVVVVVFGFSFAASKIFTATFLSRSKACWRSPLLVEMSPGPCFFLLVQ